MNEPEAVRIIVELDRLLAADSLTEVDAMVEQMDPIVMSPSAVLAVLNATLPSDSFESAKLTTGEFNEP